MEYDIIFVIGEIFFDHPLSGIAILKRILEKNGYKVGIIETPNKDIDIKKLGKPRLFFGISSGSIDSMVRNFTPLKKPRIEDKNLDYDENIPPRAVIVYSNWVKKYFKDSIIVLGGTEATLRRFVHYDYWDNKLRKPILLDSRADILAYGNSEKQILEIADRLRNKKGIDGINGTCIIKNSIPSDFKGLPSYEEVMSSKENFCLMQNSLTNAKNLSQRINNRYVLQYKSPRYTSKDLDEYYELDFSRKIPSNHMMGFEFSVVTHRGCIGDCNFCSLRLTQGSKIISRSEESILREIEKITKMPHFKGNIDDLGGPSANMFGMDCNLCERSCIDCSRLDRSNKRVVNLLKKCRDIKGVKNVFIRSGIRYDLVTNNYLQELKYHVSGKLKIAPEHVNKDVLKLMNKDKGNLSKFISDFNKLKCGQLSYYFMVGHPGSGIKETKELAEAIKHLKNAEAVQVFIPTPMTVSTCMYYTGMDPKTMKNVYVPYTYSEKKQQKRIVFDPYF